VKSDFRKKWEKSSCPMSGKSDVQFQEKWKMKISDAPSAGALVRPLWRTAAPGLKPLRLPRAKMQVIFRKRATNWWLFWNYQQGSGSPVLCLGFEYTPLFEQSSLLWSDPVGARQLPVRAKALRRHAPRALLRKMTCKDKASYASSRIFTTLYTRLMKSDK